MKLSTFAILTAALILSMPAFAANRDLGKALACKTDSSGILAFGAFYTYGIDPDGFNYVFSYSPNVNPIDGAARYLWNFYNKSTDSYLLAWSPIRFTELELIQVKVSSASDDQLAVQMLTGQRKLNGTDQLFFVLAKNDGIPVFNVSISELCSKYPDNFKDLTNNSPCDQIKP